MANIVIYNGNQRVAMTSGAYEAIAAKELMSGYTLNFKLTNSDNAQQYIIPEAVIEAEGQKYDVVQYNSVSGSENVTTILSNHVSYRTNNYKLPPMYTKLGTITEIITDILTISGANAEFTVGTCANVSGLLALNNQQESTSRFAIFALKALGVEIDYDNFTINAPVMVGADNGKVFKFDKDLCNFSKTWVKDNGTSYEADIAALQRIPGHQGDTFAVGDTVTIADVSKRIIIYSKRLDNPTQDKITLGAFIPNIIDTIVATNIAVKNTVQQGAEYSKCSIDGINGFMVTNEADTLKTVMNATDCFAVYVKQPNGSFKKVSYLDETGLAVGKLFNPDSQVYGTIGKISGTELSGLCLVKNASTTPVKFFYVIPDSTPLGENNGTRIIVGESCTMLMVGAGLPILEASVGSLNLAWSDGYGNTTEIILTQDALKFYVGGMEYSVSNTFTSANGKTVTVKNGIIISIV